MKKNTMKKITVTEAMSIMAEETDTIENIVLEKGFALEEENEFFVSSLAILDKIAIRANQPAVDTDDMQVFHDLLQEWQGGDFYESPYWDLWFEIQGRPSLRKDGGVYPTFSVYTENRVVLKTKDETEAYSLLYKLYTERRFRNR